MKKAVITLFLTTGIGFAFPVTDLGSSAFYVEAEDTVLTIECPSDGILMVGFKIASESMYYGVMLLDEVEVATDKSVEIGSLWKASGTAILPVTKGQHELRALNDLGRLIEEKRTWALFWAYDTGGAVAEQPSVSEEDITGSEVHRVGDRINFEYTSTSIYDASGRLVGRMGPGNWIPTSTGVYFITYVKNNQAELKKIVVVN
ncbi:MAG: T9SS type A sorting domain-containing protein [Candidatus Stahlbacteria bacterium]|nr:MAG: T9SS type A sorting domain-containing protein [Candidatus Stahlbacteria bacterium]